jgi:hypothetical protein
LGCMASIKSQTTIASLMDESWNERIDDCLPHFFNYKKKLYQI